jgi:hypothetical protein
MFLLWKLTEVDPHGDGTGNDTDTNDEGLAESFDTFPLDPTSSFDPDPDGIADGDE